MAMTTAQEVAAAKLAAGTKKITPTQPAAVAKPTAPKAVAPKPVAPKPITPAKMSPAAASLEKTASPWMFNGQPIIPNYDPSYVDDFTKRNPVTGVYNQTGSSSNGKDNVTPANDWTNQIYILINKLKSVGIPASTAERAGVFFGNLLDDGITDLDNAVDIFLYAKTYKSKKTGQEITSPYYQDFGKFNDALSSAKPPGVLVPWVLGIKDTVQRYDTGGTLSLYSNDEAIQNYLKNDVKVSELDERLNAARLKSITADKVYTDSLIKLGYISKAEDLTGFFASPTMGQKQLETNRNTGAFATEALRRAKEGGIQLNTDFAKKQAADLTAQGYSEAQVANISQQGYQAIAKDIMPEVKLSQIYQGQQAATASTIQSELEQQTFMGMDSERYKTLKGQEEAAFQGSAGLSGPSTYSRKISLSKPVGGAI